MDKTIRANEAKRILSEPLLIEALATIERRAIEDMLACKRTWMPWQRRKMEHAQRVANAVRDLRGYLQAAIMEVELERTRKSVTVA